MYGTRWRNEKGVGILKPEMDACLNLQANIGYSFTDINTLLAALTHSSYAHENGTAEFNERLEFLGDAVLELTISDILYRRHSQMSEGMLTKTRAALVCEPSLAELARSLALGDCMRLGRGEEITGGRDRDSLLSDTLEAVLGAVYLDGGIEEAQAVIRRMFAPVLDSRRLSDNKTALQEILQKNGGETAVYAIVNESGPSHQKEFSATVSHGGKLLGSGSGRTKKEAEQNAAQAALESMGDKNP
jgi:ribonuclease-3